MGGTQGFGTFGGYGTLWGSLSPSNDAAYAVQSTPVSFPVASASPVTQVSYSTPAAPAATIASAPPSVAVAAGDSLPTY